MLNSRLYWNTIRHLTPEQLWQQVRVRVRGTLPAGRPAQVPEELEVRPEWGPRVERCRVQPDPETLAGRFQFWGREYWLDLRKPWLAPGEGKSWNYLVHYFDHAPALAAAARAKQDGALRDAVCQHLESWISVHPPGRGVPWEPYPTALRIVNWLDAVQTLDSWSEPGWRENVLQSVYVQAAWLERHLERHLLGTHLLKDARALAIAGRVFGDARATKWQRLGRALASRELQRHVRPDGGHMEPSIYYHCIALEDVLDLINFYGASGATPEVSAASGGAMASRAEAWPARLRPIAERMVGYLQAVRPPGGGYPLFGDAAVDATPSPQSLIDYAARLGFGVGNQEPGPRHLADSGMLVWRTAGEYLIANVGGVGATHLPSHGHCDSLSFEWFVNGLPIVVDSGTQSYEIDDARRGSRSTRAHNTLQVDGREQHEMWAAWRVARRSTVRARLEETAALEAELVPWHDSGLRVRRRFERGPNGFNIVDTVSGPGAHALVSRLHLHPECEASLAAQVLRVRRGPVMAEIHVQTQARVELVEPARSGSVYCGSFGVAQPNAELRVHSEGPLPWECRFEIRAVEY